MIESIRLKNWKCHLNSYLKFSDGTNALLGVMGAGKTSILEAISFALFGTFPALQQKKVKLNDIIMKKPVRKEFAEVELEFVHNGKRYTVKRRIERKKATHAELRIDGKLVETQPQRVNEFIEDILKINFDLFTRAIYSEQNRIDNFLTLPRGERKKRIDEILHLEKFEAARASVVSLINRVKSHKNELINLLKQLKGETDINTMKDLEKEIKELEKKKYKISEEREKLSELLSKKDARLKNLSDLKEKINNLEMKRQNLYGIVSTLKEEVSKTEEKSEEIKRRVENLKRKLEHVLKKRESLEEDFEKMNKKKNEVELMLNEIKKLKIKYEEFVGRKKDIAEKVKESDEIKKMVETIKNRMEELNKKYYRAREKVSELKKSITELKEVKENCPVCDTVLSEEKKNELISKKEKEVKKLKEDMLKLSKEISISETELKNFEKKKSEFEKLEAELYLINNEIEKITDEIKKEETLKKEYEAIFSKLKSIENEVKKYDEMEKDLKVKLEKESMKLTRALENERKIEELKIREEELKELESKLEGLKKNFSEEEYESLSQEIKEIYGKLREVGARIGSIESILLEKRKRMKELENKVSLIIEYENEIKRTEQLVSDLEKFKIGLQKTQEELRKNFIFAVNQAMQSIWEELYPYGDFQSIRLFVDENDYVLQLQELDGKWVSVDHVSGGERSLAALTLRIAFALVLAPQLRWLILDEPTHNLDIKAREELAKVLRDRIGEFIDQVLLITHDPVLEDAVSGVLYKIEREKEKNGIAKIVRVEM